jgi:hypothetical protein
MPVITVSRMYGSCGSEVAERVAESLGWTLFDNDLIDAIAQRSGLSHAEVTAQDERVPSLVERLAAALSMGSPEVIPAVPVDGIQTMEERVVAVTGRIIEEAVQTGPRSLRGSRRAMPARGSVRRASCVLLRAKTGAAEVRDGQVRADCR